MTTDQGSHPFRAVDPASGATFRYQTDGVLGEGASSQVYLARRLPDGEDQQADAVRRVALKLVSKPKWKGRLHEEAKALLALQREVGEQMRQARRVYRIVRIGAGGRVLEVPNTLGGSDSLIELEYLDGETLAAWWSRWKAQAHEPHEVLAEAVRVARDLVEILEQLARMPGDLAHRDIKPGNLMRTATGLVIFDFNVSRTLPEGDDDALTVGIGTMRYMAPEVQQGQPYDTRIDLWSAGAILWEILHRREFERFLHMEDAAGTTRLRWPRSELESWPADLRDLAFQLVDPLLREADTRSDPAAFRSTVDRIHEAAFAQDKVDEQLGALDLIGLLAELSPSGLVSVVTDTSGRVPREALQRFLRERMQVDDPLEDWLVREVRQAASANRKGPVLFLLGGNAGDGKSHLLYRLLRHHLDNDAHVRGQVRHIADATHALSPEADPFERLHDFFAPFADVDPTDDDRVHVIAMNTGMVIECFEEHDPQRRFATLYETLKRQLGLRASSSDETAPPWRIEVVNLDLRDLLAPHADDVSFFERMVQRLDPEDPSGIPHARWPACDGCVAKALCPVHFNLTALRRPTVREAVAGALRRASLDAEIHLSPRNLWGFLYRLVTGGVERYDVSGFDGRCEVVRDRVALKDGPWLLSGQLTELLFQESEAGTPWNALAEQDPAYVASPRLDMLHTRISVKSELDNADELLADLGGGGGLLDGLALDKLYSEGWFPAAASPRRRDAAVRRHALLHAATRAEWEGALGGEDFPEVLEAYEAYSRGEVSADHKSALQRLRHHVQNVFLLGNGVEIGGTHYLKVSRPNARSKNLLLVKAGAAELDSVFRLGDILVPDPHIEAHAGREALLQHLGYRPARVLLSILGVRLFVDRALYDFLLRVNQGQKPSVRDMAEFQTLLFLGDRVGNHLARTGSGSAELFLWDAAQRRLYRLAVDDFDETQLTPA